MTLIEHVEKFLGQITQGWKDKGSKDGIQVVSFQDSPFDAHFYLSLGLSRHVLNISESKKVRQELIISVADSSSSSLLVSCLLYICERILSEHNALLRGQVVKLPPEPARKLGYEAVYCTMPVFADDEFATFSESDPPTVIVWLIPVHEVEADFIADSGWSKFEDLLEEKDPNLFTLDREPVV